MSAGTGETGESREQTMRRIQSGIRSAQLRVALDEMRGRETPEAVVRLAQRTPPEAAVTLRNLENAGWDAPKGPGGSERIGAPHTPEYFGRPVEGRAGKGAGPDDPRGREATGPEKTSVTRVKTKNAAPELSARPPWRVGST